MRRFLRDKSGATSIEYALIATLIAVAIIGAVTLTGSRLTVAYNSVASNLSTR